MKLLVAAARTDDWDDDFDFDTGVSVGEILEPADLCDKDRYLQWPGGCGCGRSFCGFASNERTSVAIVADVQMTLEQLTALLGDRHPDADYDELAEMAVHLVEDGDHFSTGTKLRIWRYQIEVRDADDLGDDDVRATAA